ncbi:MAG TPA: TlpA disulfide reductase family protein [Usitatibacter sp.]|nr:TlpA disulfide reductase family protein [Usitatibacter sp.]
MRRLAAALALTLSQSVLAVEAGGPVPDVSGPRIDAPSQSLALSSLRGQVVYVDFWASWCAPCRVSFPLLDALYRENGSRGFVVVGVNKDMSLEDAQKFLKKVPVTFPLVGDAKDAAAKAFDVKTMPSGYLVDRKGVVRKVHRGFTAETGAAIREEVDALLKEPS